MLARMDLNLVNPPTEMGAFQLSTKKVTASDLVCVVTGSQCYKYLKLEENLRSIVPVHDSITAAGGDGTFSDEFTCHEWSVEPLQLVLATAEGNIIVCGLRGEFILSVPNAPGMRIDCMRSYSRGLIFTGEDGMIWPYEATAHEGQLFIPQ